MSRLPELIEDGKGQLSSASLGYLFGLVILAFPIIAMTITGAYSELVGIAGIFAGMAGGTKIMAKVSDTSVERASMNPEPVPLAALGPATTINVGGQESKGEAPIIVPDAKEIVIKRKGVKMTAGKK